MIYDLPPQDKIQNKIEKHEPLNETVGDSLSREHIQKIVSVLREIVVEKIPRNIKEHYARESNFGKKISSHDHEILALGKDTTFNVDDYNELINKGGDSLYYVQSPRISFENFIEEKGFYVQSEEKKNKLKLDYEKDLSTGELTDISFDEYLNRKVTWLDENKLNELKLKYEEYSKDAYSMTQEYHMGSTAYALLRSGAYDQWIKDGGVKAELAKKIIEDLNDPRYYEIDTFPDGKRPLVRGNYDRANEVEWITSSWIELEKRGMKPTLNQDESGDSITLEDLNSINQQWLDFMLDTNEFKVKFNKYTQEEKGIWPWQHGAACDGAHVLDALVMYDIYKNDSEKLNEHLKISINLLSKTLEKANAFTDNSKKEEYNEILHDFTHQLLPFTELPDNFNLKPKMKGVVQLSLKKMLEFAEHPEKNCGDDADVATIAHAIDILTHLPKCVLERQKPYISHDSSAINLSGGNGRYSYFNGEGDLNIISKEEFEKLKEDGIPEEE